MIQTLGMLFVDGMLDLSHINAVLYAGDDRLVDDLVSGQGSLMLGDKGRIDDDQVKYVAGLHQKDELFLRHDLAELAVTACHCALLLVPGCGDLGQLIGCHIADVCLVGIVSDSLLECTEVLGQLLQILGLGVDDPFGGLCRAVMNDHIGGMDQSVACSFDNTVHLAHFTFPLFIRFFRNG